MKIKSQNTLETRVNGKTKIKGKTKTCNWEELIKYSKIGVKTRGNAEWIIIQIRWKQEWFVNIEKDRDWCWCELDLVRFPFSSYLLSLTFSYCHTLKKKNLYPTIIHSFSALYRMLLSLKGKIVRSTNNWINMAWEHYLFRYVIN